MSAPEPIPSPSQENAVKERDPVRAEELKAEGNVSFKAGKYSAAIDLYTQAYEADPENTAYLTNRAAAYMSLRMYNKAISDCRAALDASSNTDTDKIYLRLAKCYVGSGDVDAAQQALSSMNQPDAALLSKCERIKTAVASAVEDVRKGNFGPASLAIRQAERESGIEFASQTPSAWRQISIECQVGQGKLEAAFSQVTEMLQVTPNEPDLFLLRARILFLQSEFKKAITNLSRAMQLDPDFKPAKLLLKKVKLIEKAKEAGNAAFKSNDSQKAVEHYTEALEALDAPLEDDDNSKVGKGRVKAILLGNRATALNKMKDFDRALQDVNASLELDPTYFKSLRTKARIQLALKQYEDAVNTFKDALKEAGDDDVRPLKKEIRNAELELKKSQRVDYYKVLDISDDASQGDIRKAYRKMSLQHHPDRGGDEAQFKLISEAYQTLSDENLKARYDSGADLQEEAGMDGMSGFGGGFGGIDPSMIFQQFASAQGGHGGFSFGGGGGGFPSGAYSRGGGHGFQF